MIYHSIADIYAAIDDTRRRLAARVETLSATQQTFRLSDTAWSIADIIEHLAVTEERMIQLIGMLLSKTESLRTEKADSSLPAFEPFSLEEMAREAHGKKFESPAEVRPGGAAALGDSLAKLQSTRAALQALRPRLAAADLTAVSYPHPFFGALNLAQWLAFTGLHEERHLRQIERLMETPESADQAAG